MKPAEQQLLTLRDAAAQLGVSMKTIEREIAAGGIHRRARRVAGELKLRSPWSAHRIELELTRTTERLPDGVVRRVRQPKPCTTLFITGPRLRTWGFHCEREGWIPWQRFTASNDAGAIGKGCQG